MSQVLSDVLLRGSFSGGGSMVPKNSVDTDNIVDGAVTGQKIADQTIGADKLDVSVTLTIVDNDLTISLT